MSHYYQSLYWKLCKYNKYLALMNYIDRKNGLLNWTFKLDVEKCHNHDETFTWKFLPPYIHFTNNINGIKIINNETL